MERKENLQQDKGALNVRSGVEGGHDGLTIKPKKFKKKSPDPVNINQLVEEIDSTSNVPFKGHHPY